MGREGGWGAIMTRRHSTEMQHVHPTPRDYSTPQARCPLLTRTTAQREAGRGMRASGAAGLFNGEETVTYEICLKDCAAGCQTRGGQNAIPMRGPARYARVSGPPGHGKAWK